MNCPRCGLINPESAQRCDCGYDFINKSVETPYFTSSPNTALSRLAIGAQVVALVLAGAAVIWGCCMVYVALNPGPSGEFGGASVFICGGGRHAGGLAVTRGGSCGEERAPGAAMGVPRFVGRGAQPTVRH